MVERAAKVKWKYVSYEGTAPRMTALLGGHIELAETNLTQLDKVKAGKMKLLAIATEKRHPEVSDLPTLSELGIEVTYAVSRGLVAPKGTPEPALVKLAALAVQFGPWEFFSLFVLTLTIVASLAEELLVKGLLAGVFGLFVTAVGADPLMGVARFTFGTDFLLAGFPFLPVLIGVFAFSQLMKDAETLANRALGAEVRRHFDLRVSHLKVLGEIVRQPLNLIWSSTIGLRIGILPAVGGSAANILAYDQAKKFSRHPEKFGTGIPDGIIATEASNDSNVGGSLITMMAFGIPGDAVTAVMLGALIIHGIAPGPLFITTHTAVAYGMFAAYILTHFITVAASWLLLRYCLRVILTPLPVLIPIILVLSALGSYALNNIIENVWTLYLFGIIGYLMVKFGFPLAPLILGVVLGDQLELNYIRAVMTDADPWLFLTRLISGGLLALSALSVAVTLWQRRRRPPVAREAESDM
jgi:putative tricarboxylic transport membrane protein